MGPDATLYDDYLDACLAGTAQSPDEVFAEHPELEEEMRTRIRALYEAWSARDRAVEAVAAYRTERGASETQEAELAQKRLDVNNPISRRRKIAPSQRWPTPAGAASRTVCPTRSPPSRNGTGRRATRRSSGAIPSATSSPRSGSPRTGRGHARGRSHGLEDEVSSFAMHRRRSWARLLRRIYEVDPLLCPCGGELKIISIITDPVVVDRILAHRKKKGIKSPFAARALPAA